jgi:Chitobiase/beta-hexosaminidase C-terminal domain
MGRQGTIDRARTRAGRAAALAVATAATCGVVAMPAHAATGTHTISVLPDASALELSTYPGSTPVEVEVKRNGVTMATASVTTDGAGDAAVNGGTLDCWSDATPDILPGDVVQVTGPGFVDTKTVDDITSARPVQTGPGTVVVRGRGKAADGTPLPVASIETRIIGSSKDRFANGRRDLRAGGTNEYPLVQDGGDPTAFTATFAGLSSADVSKVLSSIDVREIFTDTEDPSQTIAESPAVRGPAPPCSTPMRRDAVTRANHATVNAANVASDLVLSGVTQNADAVAVNLDDASGRRVTVPATLSAPSGAQTFTAAVPADRVRGLGDGTLTASATYTIGGMNISGDDLTLVKDTVVPPAPTATPGPRTYLGPQWVTLGDDDATATVHWTAGTATPTADSPAFASPIPVTASQVIRAVAVDRAGNASPVSAFSFEIAVPVVPSIGSATPAIPAPAAAPAPAPAGAVAAAHASALRVRGLAFNRGIRAASLRRDGLRLSLGVPADAAVVRVAVSRAGRSGKPAGRPIATALHVAPGRAGTMRLRVGDRKLRRLRPGRYVVSVAIGRTRTTLGPATLRTLTVRR